MTGFDRSLARLKSGAPEADFADVRRVLEGFGYVQRRQRGSHVTFVHSQRRRFTLPLTSGKTIKRVYITELLEELHLDG